MRFDRSVSALRKVAVASAECVRSRRNCSIRSSSFRLANPTSRESKNEHRDCDSLLQWRPSSNRKAESYPTCFHPAPIAFRPQSRNSKWTFDGRRGIQESSEPEDVREQQAVAEGQLKLAVLGVAQSAVKAVALDR